MLEVIRQYAVPHLQPGDIITVSESPLAITQGRAVLVDDIQIGLLARILWRFVAKVPYGIGLRAPESMQCAIDETGSCRILFAAAVGALGKLIGRKGDFYRVAGMQAATIDAASTSPVPGFSNRVLKGPANPTGFSQRVKKVLGFETGVMDINDIGGSWLLGGSDGLNKYFAEAVMRDNPQGQEDQLTPICIIRRKA